MAIINKMDQGAIERSEKIIRAMQLRDEGHSSSQIAEALGLNESGVRGIMSDVDEVKRMLEETKD